MELQGKRVAILAEDNYEDLDLWYPLIRLQEAGAKVTVVGMPCLGQRHYGKHGLPVTTDIAADLVSAGDFDAVVVPGVHTYEKARSYPSIQRLIESVYRKGGIVATLCHGNWTPIPPEVLKNRQITSSPEVKEELVKAGARWIDREVVRDGNLISSRGPQDLSRFCRTLIDALK